MSNSEGKQFLYCSTSFEYLCEERCTISVKFLFSCCLQFIHITISGTFNHRNNRQWPPTKYPKGTFLSLAGYIEPLSFYEDLTLKRLASQDGPEKYSSGPDLCLEGSSKSPYRNSLIAETPAWLDYITDEGHYNEVPTRVAGPNPNYEVPSDFIEGTTATEVCIQLCSFIV